MAGNVSPVVKGVYVCDEVLADPASGKVSLLNAFVTVRPSSGFPFVLARMAVVIALRGGRGQSRLRVDVVQAETGAVLFRTRDRDLTFLSPLMTVYARFRLENVRFPSEGRYTIEVYAEGEFLDDEVITVLSFTETSS
jgi:hypothetical protein